MMIVLKVIPSTASMGILVVHTSWYENIRDASRIDHVLAAIFLSDTRLPCDT
jgi:hypothetical protein